MNWVLGLTGGIGSGKSTVADLLVQQGAALVDTDAIAHELTAPGGAAMSPLVASLGADIQAPDGSLDRPKVRARVFADPAVRQQLEAILHPMIRSLSAARCQAAEAPYVVLAVPLLVESGGWKTRCQRVLVVDCDESVQIARVQARNGLAETEIRRILAAQASRAERLAAADDVLDNSGELAALYPQIAALHARYLGLAGAWRATQWQVFH